MGIVRQLPPPTSDIETMTDVEEMVRRFYRDVAQDELLGPMFNDVAHVDWSDHLPKLTLFWGRVLFGVRGFTGNPLEQHRQVHERRAFTPAHFERWLSLFFDTIDTGWVGPNAEQVKGLAQRVAIVHAKQLGVAHESGLVA